MIWTMTGRCPCGGEIDDRVVQVRFAASAGDEPVVLDSVPQGACESCGSRVYHAAVLARIELVLRGVAGDGDKVPD